LPDTTDLVVTLRAAGCVFAEDEAELLMSSAHDDAELARMVEQRVSGLPLEHVVGWASFCGLRIEVDPGVFVPRRRTEILAAEAIALLPSIPAAGECPVVLDLCCGSGALGVAVASAGVAVELYAADVEAAAVRCAQRNASRVGGRVFEGDLFEPLPLALKGRVGVLLANVPYVPSDEVRLLPAEARLHEPLVTLDGGADGLGILRRLSAEAGSWLVPGGHVLVETSEDQSATAVAIFQGDGLAARVISEPEYGATIVIGTRGDATVVGTRGGATLA
jgi:release factor glutamine methyltransferase